MNPAGPAHLLVIPGWGDRGTRAVGAAGAHRRKHLRRGGMQGRLVRFHREQIVPSGRHHLLAQLALGEQGIRRQQSPG